MIRPTVRRHFRPASALVAFALIGAACSSSKSGSSPTSTDAPGGTPIKVAALIVASGPLSGHQGDSVDALNAWAKDTNSHGGIADHSVDVVVFDTKGDSATAAADARQVVGDPAFAAALIIDAAAEGASAKVLSDGGVPVIGGAGFNPTVWGTGKNKLFSANELPNVFGIATALPATDIAIVAAAKNAGTKNVAGVDSAEFASSKQATQLVQAVSGFAGLKFVGGVTVSSTQPDYTAECLQFVKNKADYVELAGPTGAEVRRLMSDCRTQGYSGYFGVSGQAITPDLYNSIGDSKLAGALYTFPWYVDADPVKRYRDVLHANGVSTDHINSPSSTAAWATMELFKKALDGNASKMAATVTRKMVIDAYHTIKNETLDGLLPGPVTYPAGQPAPAPQCFWLFTFQGGSFSGSFTPTCPGPNFAPITG